MQKCRHRRKVIQVVQLDPEVILISVVSFRKIQRVFVKTGLTTHSDGSGQVEWQIVATFPGGFCPNEGVQSLLVCRFSIAIEKECSVIWSGEVPYVHFLKV
jgi:hypothetical protein